MRQMLIVDDDLDICDCLEQFFGARGFSVVLAFSGEQALDRLATSAVEVIVLDILLPGISGLEVLRRARELCPESKIIIITGLPQPELRSEARAYGACGFVTKPFDFSETTWAAAFSPNTF